MMTANVGSLDRVLRLVLGIVLIVLPFVTSLAVYQSVAMVWGSVIVGIVMLLTGLTRICPLYSLLGIRTCRT